MRLADNRPVSESKDYILDLSGTSGQTPSGASASKSNTGRTSRPWLAVFWRCCHTYSRIYRNRDQTAYVGCCPACGKSVRAAIGPGGVSNRFFQAY